MNSDKAITVAALEDHSLLVGFIGAGNMAQAIIEALLKDGVVTPKQLLVSAPSDTHLAPLRVRGVATTHSNAEVLQGCDVVFLCVKPHVFPSTRTDFGAHDRTILCISIMTGLTLDYLEEVCDRPVIRSLPNTPCLVGEGCCVYSYKPHTPAPLVALGSRLLQVLGFAREVPEEQMNAAAAVSGSGPAYVYAAIEALADGGVKMGLPRELSQTLAAQMVRGAATMVQQTGRHPAQLKDEVCSPGGTTIAAMHALEKGGFRASLMSAVEAATERAAELADQQQTREGQH